MDSIKILVVDDEPSICSMVTRFLEMNNYQGDVAYNGKEALDMIAKNDYHLVLSDIKMPEMDGLSFMQAAKEVNPEALFIIMSGYGTLENAIQALKLGAINFIKKPLSVIELISTIKKAEDLIFKKHVPYKIGSYVSGIDKHLVFNVNELNSNIDLVVDYLVLELPQFNLTEVKIDNLTLALYETLNNAIEHGCLKLNKVMGKDNTVEEFQNFTREKLNRLDNDEYKSASIDIRLTYKDNKIQYSVTDSGEGFDYKQYLKNMDNQLYIESINKGLFLIQNIVDEMTFNQIGNEIILTINTDQG